MSTRSRRGGPRPLGAGAALAGVPPRSGGEPGAPSGRRALSPCLFSDAEEDGPDRVRGRVRSGRDPVDHVIECPLVDDAQEIARVLLAAWLQTYPDEEAGIDEAWIREHRGSVTTPEETAQWQEFIVRAGRQPDELFCRVVRCRGGIVGFLCGRREGEVANLGPMYLLREAQGGGLGGRLMNVFLDRVGESPARLWVTTYNEGAIRFYQRYGFEATGERDLWRGRLPNMRMARAPITGPRHLNPPHPHRSATGSTRSSPTTTRMQ
ncbi:hypothetical protein CQJ94_12485 [Glycomyces fuscus]|nr:hypothetical protein CQJ94_12485 [Glycomyces fuscus]